MSEQRIAGAATSGDANRTDALMDAVRRNAPRYAMLMFMVVLLVIFTIARPEQFATVDNFRSVLTENALIAVAALAVMIALVVGEFDLSVASVVGLANVLAAGLAAQQGLPLALTLLLVLVMGLVVGGLHGLFIARFNLDSFIVTLATSSLLIGAIQAYTNGSSITDGIPEGLLSLGRSEVFGLQLPVYILIALTVVLWFFLEHRPWGRALYATGINREAARLAGLPVRRLKYSALIAASVLGAVAGILLAGRAGVGHPTIATDYLLPAFAAAFLGSAAFRLGFPNAWGTLLSVYVLAVGVNGLTLIGAPFWVNSVFNGLALLIAIILSRLSFQRRRRQEAV